MIALVASDVPKLPRGVRLQADAARGRPVLLAPERAFELDEPAAHVLALVDGKRTIGDIVAALAVTFDAAPSEIEPDVIAMLEDLVAKRVVER
ncbi:pyrroloquinoline quinone biosynthesis peptide chaperone PqqD [Segnochrobactrum spirostomi]|uniref:pyrroloquinoline quinone biosynthesis peptide chaperone PqqD n=1 Tax=Segnochrobactrum spirostomi TaxID=2608987 RepID=UPI0035E4532B